MIVRRVLASVPLLMAIAAFVALIALIVYLSVIYWALTALVVIALIDPGPE